MKLLIISRDAAIRTPPIDTLLNGLLERHDADLVRVDREQAYHLYRHLEEFGIRNYDRIMVDIPLRKLKSSLWALRQISGLVLYEEDTWQEFSPHAKFRAKYARIYQRLPNARLIVTSYTMEEYFREKEVDATCVPKAADPQFLWNEGAERDVPLAFVGRVKNRIYRDRRRYLDYMKRSLGLQCLRAQPGSEYRKLLGRIGIFFSADIDFNEYMAKNFEAMLCGCAVVAYRQGGEEEKLGFKDMVNIVLYDDIKEAEEKIRYLLENDEVRSRIASSGEKLVHEQHLLQNRIPALSEILERSFDDFPPVRYRERVLSWIPGWP